MAVFEYLIILSLQESAIVLAKLLFPQIFEKMPMQEIRALVAEKSTMSTYIRGESIELPPHFMGLLLEGYIKGQGTQEELIASPAALLPWYGDMSFRGSDVSGKASSKMFDQSISMLLHLIKYFLNEQWKEML